MTKNSAKKKAAEQAPEVKATSSAITGTVVSSKMNKTIVVQVMRMVKHPLYGKYLRHYSRMYVHDADNQCQVGDVVKIQQTRPISKSKRWKLVAIVRKSELTDVPELVADASGAA
jgi:small subunit ribosomal protein S17